MALVLPLLPLLLWRVQGDPLGNPQDRGNFLGRPSRGAGESLLRRGLPAGPLGLGAELPGLQGPAQRPPPHPVCLRQRDPHRLSRLALRRPPARPGPPGDPAAGAASERGGLGHLHLQGPPQGREPHGAPRAGRRGRLRGLRAPPGVCVPPAPDPPAGRRAGAGAGRAGRGLVAAQASTPTSAAALPQTCPPSDSRAPETGKGRGAQGCGGPGPGVEPALCGPGSHGAQTALPAVPSGPCRLLHHLRGCRLKESPSSIRHKLGLPAPQNYPLHLHSPEMKAPQDRMSTGLGVRRPGSGLPLPLSSPSATPAPGTSMSPSPPAPLKLTEAFPTLTEASATPRERLPLPSLPIQLLEPGLHLSPPSPALCPRPGF